MKNINWAKILERASRWYVFLFLNFYGIGKIMGGQFYRKDHLPEIVANTTIGEASGYDLAWSFMGYSFSYILFIGVTQIIGAWLLLWERTKILGVIILFPIMVNIIVFDIIFLDLKDAVANAIIYFLMLLYILYFNKQKIVSAFTAFTTVSSEEYLQGSKNGKSIALIVIVMAFIFGVDQFFVNLIRHLSN